MAFLLKVFSGSDRLKEKQKSAIAVNETFRAELNDVQTKLEVENYELQMLVEMIYDSSYPESQKFLKQPTKDRLYAHKATISSLLFGLAAQGVSVAPLILTHFQKYGCDAIADTLIDLLELVRPLLSSKDMPEHTSDDILDAIDNQWHSSVRSSPAFGSLRGSRAPSPLHSPRVSPRQSISSPQSPFSTERMLGTSPGQISPSGLTSPRKTQSFSFSAPSSLPDSGGDVARTTPPRRSLSSHYPASDVDLSQERLQPLAEHDKETNTEKFRKRNGGNADLFPKNEADSCGKSSSYEANENIALSRNRLQSSSTSAGADGSDYAAEENCKDFSTAGHNSLVPVLPFSLNIGEHSKAFSINIPRSSKSFEVKELNGGESAGRAQVADGRGSHNDDAGVEKFNETILGFLPLGHSRSRSNSFDKPRLDFSHEQFDKSVRDVNTAVPSEGSSARVGGNEDTAENILESELPFRDSFSSSNCERQIPEKEIVASSSIQPINHVEDSEQGVLETNGQELNSTDDSLTSEKGVEEDHRHLSEDRLDVVRVVDMPIPEVAIKAQLQRDYNRDECNEVQEGKDTLSPNSMFYDSSIPTLDHENVTETLTVSSNVKVVEDESLDVPVFSSLVEGCEHDVQKEVASAKDSDGTNSEDPPRHRASSPHYTQVGELGSSSWLEKPTSIQSEGFEYASDATGLGDCIQNEVDKAEEDMEKFLPEEANNEGTDGVVDGVEGDKAVGGVVGDGDKDGKSSSMLIPVVEDDNSLVSATTIKDKEESYSLSVGPNEEQLPENSGVETEVEVQEQEPPQPRDIVEIGTDVLSQSSFSDHYDDGGDDESTSSSDDESSSSTSSSLEKRLSSSSSGDETHHKSSLPSISENETEITTTPLSVSVFDNDWHLCHVENGEHLPGNDSSGLLSSIDGDVNKAQEADRTGLDVEHVSNPDLDVPRGAELHIPSYKSVTFDLTTLSGDDTEDISSCSSLQSKDGAVPDVRSNSISCDDLDMTLANCFIGRGLASPSSSTALPNTVATGASLLSLSPQYEDGLVDDINSEVVLSSKIDGFQNLCSSANTDGGVSTVLEFDPKVTKRSLTEQKDQDADEAGVVQSVALLSENVNEEVEWKHLSENETKELQNPNHSDDNLHSETASSLQNVSGADLRMKDYEAQSPQQLPTRGSNQQVACVNDPPVSLRCDEVTHAFLLGDNVEDSLASKDLIQNESVIPSHVRVQEANDAEFSAREAREAGSGHGQLINGFRDSRAMENSCRLSGHNEVNTSGNNYSQGAQDEEEQCSPKTDSEDSMSEDYLHHAEAEEHEVPTFVSLEAEASGDAGGEFYALKGLSEQGEQYEANGSVHQSIERGNGAIAEGVNHSVEDPGNFEEAASPSEQDDEGVLIDQYGLNSADSKPKGDEIGATEHGSNQLISTEYEGERACSNGDDIKDHTVHGTSSLNLPSTVDEEGRNSLTDEADEGHDGIKWKNLEEGIPSNSVHFVKEIEVSDHEMGEAEHVTEANSLPAQGEEMSVLRVNPSELALFESQSKENPVQEDVVQFPEHDDLLLAEEKRVGELGATYITPSNICDGNMIYHVGPDHDEGNSDKEKDLVVHLDEVILPNQGEGLEGQYFKQVLDGVNFSNTTEPLRNDKSETSCPSSEYEDGKEMRAASEVPQLLAYSPKSSCSRGEHTLEHTHEFFGVVPAAPEDMHPVKGMSPHLLANSALNEKDKKLPRKGTLLEESGVALVKNEEVGEGRKVSDGVQIAQLSNALTNEVDEWEIKNKNDAQQMEKGSDTFLSVEEPAIEGTKEPILHTLKRGMEVDEKDNHMEFITEPTTYGVLLHNTTFLGSQGNFVKALTAPVTMARSTEVLQSGPERHNIRDSIICTSASSAGSSRTHKSVLQRRRYNLFRTLCCTGSKSSGL